MKTTTSMTIPDRPLTGLPRSAPSAAHQGGGDKCATGAKLRGRKNITIGTWNVRTLRPEGKVEELIHEMDRYILNILGLCEMRWKDSGETTSEGHKLYYSGVERSHIHGVGFLVHKDTVNTVMGCYPISSRLMTIRLRAAPFNITVIQVYAPTTDYEEEQVEDFYNKLQNTIDIMTRYPKKIYWWYKGTVMQKLAMMHMRTGRT